MSSTPRREPSASPTSCCRPVRCCRPAPASPMRPRAGMPASSARPWRAISIPRATSRRCRSLPGRANASQNAGPDMPHIPSLRATDESLRNVDRWAASHAGGRRIVTITLRNYAYMPARNSNMQAWIAFARCSRSGALHARVRSRPGADAQRPDAGAAGLHGARRGSLESRAADGALRAGLHLDGRQYRPHGPVLAQCAHPLRHAQDGTRRTCRRPRARSIASLASSRGARCRLPAPTQELVWEDDTLAAIQRAFTRIAERIESEAQGA